MTADQLKAYFEQFNSMTALVVGDVMVDAYLYGDVERISPEAPVPVVNITKDSDNRLGGAANVALNLRAMGAKAIICSVIGEDEAGQSFRQRLAANDLTDEGVVGVNDRPTTIKTRIISGQHQMLRIDKESTASLSTMAEDALLDKVKAALSNGKVDVIIFEDYNKGVLTPRVIGAIVELAKANGIPTTVDPKKRNFTAFKGVTLFKPNLKEIKEGLHIDVDPANENDLIKAAETLQAELANEFSLITLSEHGIFIHSKESHAWHPAMEVNIADVSGAGDTVICVASLCLASGMPLPVLAKLANMAGGQVCEQVGVVPVRKNLLLEEALQLIPG